MVADLIIRAVVNVLRHVAIQDLKGGGVERIAPVDSRHFIVLGSPEFGVLCLQIGLDFARPRKEIAGWRYRH